MKKNLSDKLEIHIMDPDIQNHSGLKRQPLMKYGITQKAWARFRTEPFGRNDPDIQGGNTHNRSSPKYGMCNSIFRKS